MSNFQSNTDSADLTASADKIQISSKLIEKIVHDLRNPLAVFSLGMEIIKKKSACSKEDQIKVHQVIHNIESELTFLSYYLNNLIGSLNFEKFFNQGVQELQLKKIWQTVINKYPVQNQHDSKIIAKFNEINEDFLILANENLLANLFFNILNIIGKISKNCELTQVKVLAYDLDEINYFEIFLYLAQPISAEYLEWFKKNKFIENNMQIYINYCYNVMPQLGGDMEIKIKNEVINFIFHFPKV